MELTIERMGMDIFEYLKSSETQYFFLADIDEGTCKWTGNAKELLMIREDYTESFDWSGIVHPIEYQEFLEMCKDIQHGHIRQVCEEFRFRTKVGGYVWVQCNISSISTQQDSKGMLSGMITILKIENTYDPVTTLSYISSFRSKLSEIVRGQRPWGILLIGIDDFKRINDLYSYSFGDSVLADFAQRLELQIPMNGHLFRLDGDGFGILCPDLSIEALSQMFENIQEMAQSPVAIEDSYVSFTISGGICRYPEDGTDSDTLYRNVHIAYVEAKRRGKRQVTVCSSALCTQTQRRMRLLDTLRESVQDNCRGFSLKFQPLIHARDEALYGCEVLLRWVHPEFPEGVSPYEFIPILEGSGLIFAVNKWLLAESFFQCAKWIGQMSEFQMSLNFSYLQFEDAEFKFTIMNMLKQTGVPASAITLELTETEEIKDTNKINEMFNFLRSQGIKIALDDFGMGYSSLSIFQMLQVDELKVDRSFLQRLTYDVTDQALVRQIIELCHSMNIMVCVEGVESSQIIEIIKQFKAELLQGFYFDRPLASEEFEEKYLRQRQASEGKKAMRTKAQEQSMVYSSLRPTNAMSMEMIVNNAHAGIFQVAMDEQFSFITCNEGYRKMLGYTTHQIETKFGNNALGIVYPEDMEYVNEEIRHQLGHGDTVTIEFRVVRSDGTPIWILGTGNVVKTADGSASLVVIIIDQDKFKKKRLGEENQKEIMVDIGLDELTGVFNKKTIERAIRDFLNVDQAQESTYALCVLDADDFKEINKQKGYACGDQVLSATGQRLKELFGKETLIGRAGGDEFVVFTKVEDSGVEELGKNMVRALGQPVNLGVGEIAVSFSVGIALYPQDGMDFYKLFRLAEGALYLVKAKGKARYHIAASTDKSLGKKQTL